MTWEELVEKAQEIGYEYDEDKEELKNCDAYFYKIGGEVYNCYLDLFAEFRTPEQMFAIMEALR